MKKGEIKKTFRKWNSVFCKKMTCRSNMKRDTMLIIVAVLLSAVVLANGRWFYIKVGKVDRQNQASAQQANYIDPGVMEKLVSREVKAIQDSIDTANWKNYQSNWYGFEIKYADNWLAPKAQAAKSGSNWEYSYQFRKNEVIEDNPYIGFDVNVYSLSKIKEITGTDEFPKLKESQNQQDCSAFSGYLLETGDYQAEQIYVPTSDNCYKPALFFSTIEGEYIYNIVPVSKEGVSIGGDPRTEVGNNFPEFFAAVSNFGNIEIVRPKPAPLAPKITAPRPVSFKKDELGRLVCAKKNDKPSKSKKDKGKHLDLECCLDPDEYPNPWCYYPLEKYGKYL